MNLIRAFETGHVEGVEGLPEKTIETGQSKVFLLGEKAYKVYKYYVHQYADMRFLDTRRVAYHVDFEWNHVLSPTIYPGLRSVREENGRWIQTTDERAEDYYFLMMRLDETQGLNEKLRLHLVTQDDLREILVEMRAGIAQLTEVMLPRLADIVALGWSAIMAARINETGDYGYTAAPHILRERTKEVCTILKNFLTTHPYFPTITREHLEVAPDNHSDNICYVKGKPLFFDVLMTQPIRQVADEHFNAVRLAADVAVVGGQKEVKGFYDIYAEMHTRELPEKVARFYEVYNAFLKAAYLFNTGYGKRAKQYMAFVDATIPVLT